MPAISSGIFGFPKDRCAKILVEECKAFLQGNNDGSDSNSIDNNNVSTLDIIEFCIFDNETLRYFQKEFLGVECTNAISDYP